jgi:hypothetical protein
MPVGAPSSACTSIDSGFSESTSGILLVIDLYSSIYLTLLFIGSQFLSLL